jgi:hypothetical protein
LLDNFILFDPETPASHSFEPVANPPSRIPAYNCRASLFRSFHFAPMIA